MKNKPISPIIIIVAVALILGILYLKGTSHTRPKLSVQPIGDRGLFVGDSTKKLADAKPYNHQDALRAIDQAWDYITQGGLAYQAGRYQESVEAFQKAYALDKGSRAVSGFDLAKAYEKLSRYDDAITQLNRMIQNGELSKLGIQDAQEMIFRLLAAKASAEA